MPREEGKEEEEEGKGGACSAKAASWKRIHPRHLILASITPSDRVSGGLAIDNSRPARTV